MVWLIASAAAMLAAAIALRGRPGLVLLAAGLFTLLGALTMGMHADWLVSFDTALENWSDRHRTDRRGELAAGIWAFLGDPLHALIIAVVGGTLLSLRMKSPIPVVLVTGAVGVGVAVEETLKTVIPPHSFPSGHVTVATTLFGMIAVCLAAGDSRLAKVALGVLVAESVFLVAALAVYSGAHTFTDVLGGALLGSAILASGAALLDYARRPSGGAVRAGPPRVRRAFKTPARAAAGGRPGWASPGRPAVPGPDDVTRPLPRL
ncbi:MAG: phosphatase PAP2 family protein [Mycobacterium sp.]|nr:phosphatase PAP2 family protein [Mycobacterium sp.]